MQRLFLVSILFLLNTALLAQVGIQLGQQAGFGGVAEEFLGKAIKDINGNYFIVGDSRSGISGNKTSGNYGESDVWLIKTNTNLQKEWELVFGGAGIERLADITFDSYGNVFLASSSLSGISGNKSTPSIGAYDYWLLKLGHEGNIIWQKSFGTDTSDNFFQIFENDGYVYMIGNSIGDTSIHKTELSKGGLDFWILKLDSAGNKVWDKTVGSASHEFLNINSSSLRNNQNGLLIACSTEGGISGDKTENNFGSFDTWLVMLNDSGYVEWEKSLGGSGWESNLVVIEDEDYITLAIMSDSPISGNKTEDSKGLEDCWLIELDQNGNILRQKVIGGDKRDAPYAMIKDSHGNLVITFGSASGISGDKTEPHSGPAGSSIMDIWIVSIDENWNILWQKTIGGNSYEIPSGIIEVENNKYIVYGRYGNSTIPNNITLTNYGSADFFIIELFTTVNIEESISVKGIEVFPNPSSGLVNIRTSQSGTYRLQVINASGQLLHDTRFSETVYQYDFSGLASGMYVINLQTPDGKTAYYKVLVDRDYK